MYFKLLLATVTLFLWSFSSSEALTCKSCEASSVDCRSGKDKNDVTSTCGTSASLDMFCVSYIKQGRTVYRGCVGKPKTNTDKMCDVLKKQNPTFTNCKECSSDKCNDFNYDS